MGEKVITKSDVTDTLGKCSVPMDDPSTTAIRTNLLVDTLNDPNHTVADVKTAGRISPEQASCVENTAFGKNAPNMLQNFMTAAKATIDDFTAQAADISKNGLKRLGAPDATTEAACTKAVADYNAGKPVPSAYKNCLAKKM